MLLVWDSISPQGHIAVNKKFLEILGSNVYEYYVSEEVASLYFGATENVCGVPDSVDPKRSLIGFFRQIFFFIKLAYRSKSQSSVIVLFSYDILLLPIYSIVSRIFGIKLITFEHNTVPERGNEFKQKWKRVIHRYVSHVECRVCVAPEAYIIYKNLKLGCVFVGHPISAVKVSDSCSSLVLGYKNQKIVFCPSASANIASILDKARSNQDCHFLIKGNGSSTYSNVTYLGYLDYSDYIGYISCAHYIYIPFNSSTRVSGPMFESISLNKKIVLSSQSMYDHFIVFFPRNLVLDHVDLLFRNLSDVGTDVENKIAEVNKSVSDRLNELCECLVKKSDG